MRTVPERPAALQILTVLAGFLVGPLVALRLGMSVTPDSGFVQGIAPLSFAVVFALGAVLWCGVGIVTVVAGGLWRLIRTRSLAVPGISSQDRIVPSGSVVFVVLGVLVGGALGLASALLGEVRFLPAFSIWVGAGAGYGLLLHAAARHGYLPFLEPE